MSNYHESGLTSTPSSANEFEPVSYRALYSAFFDYNVTLLRVASTLLDRPVSRVMDLGCGVGLSTEAALQVFPDVEILAFDPVAEMIADARQNAPSARVTYEVAGAAEAVAGCEPSSFDLIFIKSAYHHFEAETPVETLLELLRPGGSLLLLERTATSAASFPLCAAARRLWVGHFSPELVARRLNPGPPLLPTQIKSSSYGEYVPIPSAAYFKALKDRQLSFLWPCDQQYLNDWIDKEHADSPPESIVYEEFDIYSYTRR